MYWALTTCWILQGRWGFVGSKLSPGVTLRKCGCTGLAGVHGVIHGSTSILEELPYLGWVTMKM